ncbi:MAG TPA: glycosyltransferase family protein [Caulobacteraceae bacterium]
MIVAVVQARMSSNRLPGKVMAPILGEPMIAKQLERVRRARTLSKVVVATSTDCSDEPLACYLTSKGQSPFRGSLRDVLGRVAGAARAAGEPTHVVRLTADCPLIDPEVIDEAVRLALASGAAYVGNIEPRTYPVGLEVEVMTAEALFAADAEATDPREREDVALFLRRRPERFAHAALTQPVDRSALRWAVDGPGDFAFVRGVYEALYPTNREFGSREVLDLMCEDAGLAVHKDGLARAA